MHQVGQVLGLAHKLLGLGLGGVDTTAFLNVAGDGRFAAIDLFGLGLELGLVGWSLLLLLGG